MDTTGTMATATTPDELAAGRNRLLAGLDDTDRSMIAPRCQRVRLAMGTRLAETDQPMPAAYFPERGIVSVIRRDGHGERTELCLIGPEAFVGIPLVLASGRSPYEMVVQIDDLDAIRLEADDLVAAIEQSPSFLHRLLGSVHTQMVQVSEGLASAAWQKITARLARWLLMCRDRIASDRIAVTHEVMALMIGAQRTGITAALHELEGQGLISAMRGQVMLRDIPGLERVADGSYGMAEREQGRMLGG